MALTGHTLAQLPQRVQSRSRSRTGRAVTQLRSRLPSHGGIMLLRSRAGSTKSAGPARASPRQRRRPHRGSQVRVRVRRPPGSYRPPWGRSQPWRKRPRRARRSRRRRVRRRCAVVYPRRSLTLHAHDGVHDRQSWLGHEHEVHEHRCEVVAIRHLDVVLRLLEPGMHPNWFFTAPVNIMNPCVLSFGKVMTTSASRRPCR